MLFDKSLWAAFLRFVLGPHLYNSWHCIALIVSIAGYKRDLSQFFLKEETEIFHRNEDCRQAWEEPSERAGVQGSEEAEIPVPGRLDPRAGASQREAEGRDEQVCRLVWDDWPEQCPGDSRRGSEQRSGPGVWAGPAELVTRQKTSCTYYVTSPSSDILSKMLREHKQW